MRTNHQVIAFVWLDRWLWSAMMTSAAILLPVSKYGCQADFRCKLCFVIHELLDLFFLIKLHA